jgi:hypothetical protein
MINVSETAASKINELLAEENKANSGLRVFVQGGGCPTPVWPDDRGERPGLGRPGVRIARRSCSSIRSASATSPAPRSTVDTITGGGFTIKNPRDLDLRLRLELSATKRMASW